MTCRQLGMKRSPGWILLIAAGVATAWAAWPRAPKAEAVPESSESIPAPTRLLRWQGAASCAAMACHNGGGPRGSKGSEYTTWLTEDPHHRAYSVLFDPRSGRIEQNFRKMESKAASKDTLCLGCHVHPDAAALAADAPLPVSDGVSCESCHGPAERWRTTHYLRGWNRKSDREKEELGMQPTKDLVVRARVCAGCHVGAGDRDVNHDLIAAGHPRLTFEYGSFLANIPKHWSERAEKARHPDFEARVWAIGQVASAQATLELLAYRANHKDKPWPEFAEYNCYSCHHDLYGRSWRQDRYDRKQRPPGSLSWGTWYLSMLPQVKKSPKFLSDLQESMGKTFPDRDQVASPAQEAARQIGTWLENLDTRFDNVASLHQRLRMIAEDQQKTSEQSWDGAAQLYLALAALYQAEGDLDSHQRDPQLKSSLDKMAELLAFPHSGATKYDSPREGEQSCRQNQFRGALEDFRQRLDSMGR